MTEIEYLKKVSAHREEIEDFESLLSDDPYKVTYMKDMPTIKTLPLKMSEKLAFAFKKLYTEKGVGKASRDELIKEIDDADAEKILNYFERSPRKWIETEGDCIYLRSMFRTIFKISHEHKTISEKIDEMLKEAPKLNSSSEKAGEVKESKKKAEKKNKITEYFERTKCYMSKDIRNSLNASSRIIKPLEESIKKFIQPTRDFLHSRIILRNYHAVLVLPAFLAAMYLFGSRENVIKPLMKFEENIIGDMGETPVKAYYGLKNSGIETSSKIKRKIKNAYASSIKGTEKACDYAVCLATTTYSGFKEGVKNSDLALYFAKKEKDSVESSFQGYINRKVGEDLERSKIDKRGNKK